MASVSSTSSASQYGLQQVRVQEAVRSAEQAEQTAQALRAQANDAQRVADRAKENARSLFVQSDQAEARAGQARQGVAAMTSARQGINQIANAVDQAVGRQPVSTPASPAPQGTGQPAVVNSQGQVTGTVINTTA